WSVLNGQVSALIRSAGVLAGGLRKTPPGRRCNSRALGVGKRFIEAGGFAQFVGFQDGAAVQTLDIFGVLIFGDQPLVDVLAVGGIGHEGYSAVVSECLISRAPQRGRIITLIREASCSVQMKY